VRRSRRAVFAAAVLVAVGAAGVVVAFRSVDDAHQTAGVTPAGWSRLPVSPLSPRRDARAVTVGSEVIFVGGWRYAGCGGGPIGPECVDPGPLLDGAAYDVRTQTWRPIRPAPAPPGNGSSAVVGNTAYLEEDGAQRLLAYDVTADAWRRVPQPIGVHARAYSYSILAANDHLIACYEGSEGYRDQQYDPASRTWRELPPDPFGPSSLRSCAAAGSTLVVLSSAPNEHRSRENPNLARAAVYNPIKDSWRKLPDSTRVSTFPGWSWDGTELVNASQDSPYGGPLVGAGTLDPASGKWGAVPTWHRNARVVAEALRTDGLRLKAYRQYLYDTEHRRWLTPPRPPKGISLLGAQAWVGDTLVVWGGGTFSVGRGPANSTISAAGGVFQLRETENNPPPAGSAVFSTPHPPVPAPGICPGPQPCNYDYRIKTELKLDGRVIRGRSNPLDGTKTYDLTLTVDIPDGMAVTNYYFGESSGGFGIGPNGPTGIRFLKTGSRLENGSTITLKWKPVLTGHRYLAFTYNIAPPGGQEAGIGDTVGEFQIS
jgi:hypothetical protein